MSDEIDVDLTPAVLEPKPVQKETRRRKPKTVVFEPFRKGVKVGGRTIELSSAGDDVRRLQHILNRRGAALVTDGLFGLQTEAAVKAVQKRLSIKADGVVDRETWAALGW